MMRKLAAVAALATLGVLAFAAISPGEGRKQPLERNAALRQGHAVDAPSGANASAIRGLRVRYFETIPFAIAPDGRDDSYMLCPRGYRVIDGFFLTDGGIVADTLAVGPAIRRYNFGLVDLTGQPGQAVLGITCLKGATS